MKNNFLKIFIIFFLAFFITYGESIYYKIDYFINEHKIHNTIKTGETITYNPIHLEYFHNKIQIIDPDEFKKEENKDTPDFSTEKANIKEKDEFHQKEHTRTVKPNDETFPIKKELTKEEKEAKRETARKRLENLRKRLQEKNDKNLKNKTDSTKETKQKNDNKLQNIEKTSSSFNEKNEKEKRPIKEDNKKIIKKKIKTHNNYQKEEYERQFIEADETTGLFFKITESYKNNNIESFINENNNLFTEFKTNDEPININIRSIEAPWNKDNNLIIIDVKADEKIIETINMSFFFNRESVYHYRLIGYENYVFDAHYYNKDKTIYFYNNDSSVENVKISSEFTIIFEIQKEFKGNRSTKSETSDEALYIDMKYTEHTTAEQEYPIEILVKNSLFNKNETEKTKIAAIIAAMAHHKGDQYISYMNNRYITEKYSLENIEKEIHGDTELNQNLKLQRLLKTTGRKITFE